MIMATPEARLWASVRRYPHISACARSHCVHCHASAARAASAIAAFSPTLLPPLYAALCALSMPVCALALSRPLCLTPLCPTFAFSCALAPRRSSLKSAVRCFVLRAVCCVYAGAGLGARGRERSCCYLFKSAVRCLVLCAACCCVAFTLLQV